MSYEFTLHKESIKRKFAVYVVIATSEHNTKLYVGKTGDNRAGCNPIISRCGNHFSYNKLHSQVRNNLEDHESRNYTYVFDYFDDYPEDKSEREQCIARVNEMERWLNEEIQKLITKKANVQLLNPYRGCGYISSKERDKRRSFRTTQCEQKIKSIAETVGAKCS